MSDVNITVTQVANVVGKFSKQHPIIAGLSFISVVLAIWWTSIQISNYYANVVYPDQIYLSLWETGKKIPIYDYTSQIPPVSPIKPNETVTLRFILTQNNTNAPQITSIFLTLPDDAKATPIPYNGWSWERNNDVANRYFLNFTTVQIPANGEDYNLPALNVVFPNVGRLPFSYQIISNKLKPIRRDFAINTALKYDEWITKGQYYPMGETNVPMVSGNNYNSATPQTVMVQLSTVTPDAKVSTGQKTK